MALNSIQSNFEELKVDNNPKEVIEQFYDFFNNIPFIQNLAKADRKRAKDLPRDAEGKIEVNITEPHILEDMDYFRPSAIHFQKYGCYTKLRPNPNPNSEYGKWIRNEIKRSWYGYVRPSDGEWITGDYYYYLNYCPIQLIKKLPNGQSIRTIDFPRVWDGQYLVSHYLYNARLHGHHASELASRGKGKSHFGASLLAKRFKLGENQQVREKVQSVVTASDKKYIYGPNQILNMFKYYIDFQSQHTQFPRQLLTDSAQLLMWESGFKDKETGVRKGSQNAVIGVTTGVNQDKLNGSRGVLYLIEEAGIFSNLGSLYQMIRPSVEDGKDVYGLIFSYGCVCAGTKVLDEHGNLRVIEDIKLGDKLLGYNGNNTSVEDITYIQDEAYKECVRITTSNNHYIECSIDHPLLALNRGICKNTCSFYKANELKEGAILLMPKTLGDFGNIHEKDAFLLGALFGDGDYLNGSCVSLSISTEEEYEYYNRNYSIGISKLSKSDNTYAQIYFRSMHPLLKKYKMDRQSFKRKTLPYNINIWNKESVCEFLSGYFNADGNIQIVKQKHRAIKLTCKYENILIQIQYLLQKLGITSRILKEEKPERILHSNVNKMDYLMPYSTIYVLYITRSEDIVAFRNNLHFIIKDKQNRLHSYIESKRKSGYYRSLPFVLRDNNKGKFFIDKTIDNTIGVSIKKIEYIGKKRIYNLTANTTHTYITNGFISSNTAGDENSNFTDLQEMMYNPDGYNMEKNPNVWDKEGQGRKWFTFFYPAYLNRANCMDENGNSNITKALLEICQDRYKVKYNSTDINAITKRISQYPITPQEAIIRAHSTIFPITELNERLNQIDNNPNFYNDTYIGDLVFNGNGEVEFVISNDVPIRDFPTKDNKITGAIEIYALPEKDSNGKIPNERYIAGADPYDDDSSNTMSLGSFFILDTWTDTLAMEYTGRPMFANDYFEICRKGCLFYNAKLMYENNKKGLFAYFSMMNSSYLLAITPNYLKDKQLIKDIGYGNKAFGINATTAIKGYGYQKIREWLLQPYTKIEKDAEGHDIEVQQANLYRLKNRALIKELILWNPDINVDRIMAMVQLMLYREEKMILYGGNMSSSGQDSGSELADDPFFKQNYDARYIQ